MDITNFDWGWLDNIEMIPTEFIKDNTYDILQYHKKTMYEEIFLQRYYEKFFEVEQGDIVVDVGSSVGPFTYSILDKKPKHVFCIEPSEIEFKTLVKNTIGYPVTQINKGISNHIGLIDTDYVFGTQKTMDSITFEKFRKLYGIDKIDFLKTDCEGGEYNIFCESNLEFIFTNVKKISGEWHLSSDEEKINFRKFRDNVLSKFSKYHILSVDGIDIKWDLWNEHFIEYYKQVLIFIDNRN